MKEMNHRLIINKWQLIYLTTMIIKTFKPFPTIKTVKTTSLICPNSKNRKLRSMSSSKKMIRMTKYWCLGIWIRSKGCSPNPSWMTKFNIRQLSCLPIMIIKLMSINHLVRLSHLLRFMMLSMNMIRRLNHSIRSISSISTWSSLNRWSRSLWMYLKWWGNRNLIHPRSIINALNSISRLSKPTKGLNSPSRESSSTNTKNNLDQKHLFNITNELKNQRLNPGNLNNQLNMKERNRNKRRTTLCQSRRSSNRKTMTSHQR